MINIVTHAGIFHADEVTAIALLSIVSDEINVVRTNEITDDMRNDPNTLVLDIGGVYDPDMGMFDHHHNSDSLATNILILNYIKSDLCNMLDIVDIQSQFIYNLKNDFMYGVSYIDTGIILVSELPKVGIYSSIISGFNAFNNGFNTALDYAKLTLKSVMETAKAKAYGKQKWDTLVTKKDKVAIYDFSDIIVGWNEHAIIDNIFMLITPNTRGGYQVMSRNTKELKLPKDINQTFLHNSNFMCVFPTKKLATDYADKVAQFIIDDR